MSRHVSLHEWIEGFEWESQEQEKGFRALCTFLRVRKEQVSSDRPESEHIEDTLMAIACWFIQKDHESNEWYNERLGAFESRVNENLAMVLEENRSLRGQVEELKAEISNRARGGNRA